MAEGMRHCVHANPDPTACAVRDSDAKRAYRFLDRMRWELKKHGYIVPGGLVIKDRKTGRTFE